MKRIILALIISINLFSDCSDPNIKYVLDSDNTYENQIMRRESYGDSIADNITFTCSGGSALKYFYSYNSAGYNYFDVNQKNYYAVTSCPLGTQPDSNNICASPSAPQTCSWAVQPPYYPTSYTELSCNNSHKSGLTGDSYYKWNLSWCSVDSTCYGRKYSCPAGMIFDAQTETCRTPKDPYSPSCGDCGFYKTPISVTNATTGETICAIKYTCKCNPKVTYETPVSCGSGPVDPQPETNPDAPTPQPDAPKPSNIDHSAKCGTDRMMAKSNCDAQPGKVLKFECNPLTGISRSTCEYPTNEPEEKTIDPGDDTKGTTTEDIKNLSNDLPKNIEKALSKYFTDGSMPYLESIKGSLEATVLLDSDRNDKLDSISSSIDGSLVLQSEANEKLDGIKSSTDGVKGSIDSLKGSVDSQKSTMDKILEFFEDDTEYDGEDMPTNGEMSPDSNTTDGFDTFTNSITSVQNQFNQAQAIFSGGVPVVDFGSGSCPTYSFMGKSVSISSIGQSISPYSSIFSILIYISLMINIFRMIFGFFSKGV